MKFNIPEHAKLVNLLAPAADSAGRTGAYISMKNASRCYLIVHMTQGNAATVLLTPLQATAVAGTSSKVLAKTVPIWANLDTAASDALVRATDAVNYTTDAGVKLKQVVFQIDGSALDADNSFDCIGISTGASNAANITAVQALLVGERYQQVTPPSAVAD
jgi:hypothetical protein